MTAHAHRMQHAQNATTTCSLGGKSVSGMHEERLLWNDVTYENREREANLEEAAKEDRENIPVIIIVII